VRFQTPSHLKWLLVERATITGDIERLQESQARIALKIARLEEARQALDTTMELMDRRVSVRAAGTIRAHTKEYGRRGAFKAFVVATMQNTPDAIAVRTIAEMARAHFGLEFNSPEDFVKFQTNSVQSQVRQLSKAGLVEILRPTKHLRDAVWRWKRTVPSLADMAAEASRY
jgi:hypothetical protein